MNKQLIGNLSSQQLRRAVSIKEQIETLEAELDQLLGGAATAVPVAQPAKGRGRRPLSPEARARIVAAQKLRWAKVRKTKGLSSAAPAKRAKRKMSAAARARLAELAKARWAKVKAAGKKRL